MGNIKKLAYMEPLVDTVDAEALVTNSCKVYQIDMHTVKVEDMTWSSQFKLQVQRNDFIHALVAYFDIEFSKCHKPVYFSTGPEDRYTHWKQTVFYLEDVITANKGEIITGVISTAPNKNNFRDLDINIKVDFNGKYGSVHREQFFRLR
jgi:protein arginine N-methyltransferase 1